MTLPSHQCRHQHYSGADAVFKSMKRFKRIFSSSSSVTKVVSTKEENVLFEKLKKEALPEPVERLREREKLDDTLEFSCRLIGRCEAASLHPAYCYKLASWYAAQSDAEGDGSGRGGHKGCVKLSAHLLHLSFPSTFMSSLKERYQKITRRKKRSPQDGDKVGEEEPTTIFDENFAVFPRRQRDNLKTSSTRHSWHSLSDTFHTSNSTDDVIALRDVACCGIVDRRFVFLISRDRRRRSHGDNDKFVCHVVSFVGIAHAEKFKSSLGRFFATQVPHVTKASLRQSFSVPPPEQHNFPSLGSHAMLGGRRSINLTPPNPTDLRMRTLLQKRRLVAVASNPM